METTDRLETDGVPDNQPRCVTRETLDEGAGEKKREWLQFLPPSEFLSFEPPKDFILMGQCHLTRGGISVLGGWPGVGKSRATLALAIAGATGVPWMGYPVHARFRTLIVQCENGMFRLKSELNDAIPEGGLDDWLSISPPPPFGLAFQEAGFCAELAKRIAEWKPGLVIIDPWNRAVDGDKQADYRAALDAILGCLPARAEEKPAVLIVHHMRKKGSDTSARKTGRDLLHELAGSYQIGSAARSAFVLEPSSTDTENDVVVLTCCKNNDGMEGAPSAWHRRNGLFEPCHDFDMEGFLNGEGAENSRRVPFEKLAAALRGMRGETRGQAVQRLVLAHVCGKSKGYTLLNEYPENIEFDAAGKLWWREGGENAA